MPPVPVPMPDRYRVTGHVASGGMAAVYAASDEVLGRDVAIKVLAEHLNEEPDARRRFEREARAAAVLSSHPHVVTIYDVGEHAGRAFIVMELLKGGSLAAVLSSGERVPQDTVLRWLRDAASALDAAHAAGIVHRDIKPANLLLDDRGGIAIADFGIARLAESDQVTMTGQVLGTAAYLSPEQAIGETAVAASDIYALTVLAFELLTGRRPFVGENFAAQARAHLEDEPPLASAIDPALPRALDPVLDRGLAKAPDDRWPSAMALVDAIEGAVEDGQDTTRVMAAPVPAPRRRAPLAPAAPPTRAPDTAPAGRRSSRLIPILAVLALLGAGGAALAAFGGGGGGGGDGGTGGGERAERTERTATPTATATAEPTAEASAEPTEEPTAEPTPTATPTATATPTPTPDSAETPTGDAGSLNDQGFALIRQERWEEAVPPLQRSVELCGDRTSLNPCAFALFNLGQALNRSGRSAEAIPFLERRLEISDNQRGVVRAELAQARRSAG